MTCSWIAISQIPVSRTSCKLVLLINQIVGVNPLPVRHRRSPPVSRFYEPGNSLCPGGPNNQYFIQNKSPPRTCAERKSARKSLLTRRGQLLGTFTCFRDIWQPITWLVNWLPRLQTTPHPKREPFYLTDIHLDLNTIIFSFKRILRRWPRALHWNRWWERSAWSKKSWKKRKKDKSLNTARKHK